MMEVLEEGLEIVYSWMQAVLSIQLITSITWLFFLLIVIQIVALARCLHVIVKAGTLKDIRQFLKEYWQWSHFRENSLMLSLWLSSCAAYLTVLVLGIGLADIPMNKAFELSPLLSVYVGFGLIVLIGYTISKTNEQIRSTRVVVSHLKKMRLYSTFKSVLRKVQGSSISGTSWGVWVGAMASTTEWLSDRWVKKKIDSEMKKVMVEFSVSATLEYFLRMSIVAVAMWISYQ
jgi:hypothetical protein